MDGSFQHREIEKIQQLMEWERYDEAIKEAQELIQMAPDDPDGYALLASCYFLKEDYQTALHWSAETLKKEPEHETAWDVTVRTHYEQKNWDAFREAVEEALRLDPYDADYYFLRGNMYNKDGKFKKAKADFEKCLELYPENALFLANYAYVQSLLDDKKQSRALQEKALELNPDNDYVFMYLAWAAEKRGDYQEARDLLENAVRLDPDNKQIRKEYMEILQKQYWFYRVLLFLPNQLSKWKAWQILLAWFVCWLFLRSFVIVFLVLYIAAHWLTKLIVHVKIFGWRFSVKKG